MEAEIKPDVEEMNTTDLEAKQEEIELVAEPLLSNVCCIVVCFAIIA
jgi:hypothetical protein